MHRLYIPLFIIRLVCGVIIKRRIRSISLTVGLERPRLFQVLGCVVTFICGHRVDGYFIWCIFFFCSSISLRHLMTYVVFSIACAIIKWHIWLKSRVVGLDSGARSLWMLFKVIDVCTIATKRITWRHVASVMFDWIDAVQVPWSIVGCLFFFKRDLNHFFPYFKIPEEPDFSTFI